MVQWLRLHVSKAGGPGSIPRSHLPQLRPGTAKYIYVYIYIYICVYIYIYIYFFLKKRIQGQRRQLRMGTGHLLGEQVDGKTSLEEIWVGDRRFRARWACAIQRWN